MHFFKRLLCLLLFTALAFPACAEPVSAYLSQLDVLSQYDPRLTESVFVYRGKNFWENGCQPASVANGFIACFGNQVQDAPALLSELLELLAPKAHPEWGPVSLSRLSYLWENQHLDTFPTLNRLIDGMDTIASVKLLDTESTLSRAISLADERFLLTGHITLKKHWDWLAAFTNALDKANLGDIRISICSLGAGTGGTRAPFRSVGKFGHYVSIFLQVDEFASTGTFYLLDSFPRALQDEAYGKDMTFRYAYTFWQEQYQKEMAYFTDVYTVSRISPTVLRVSLQDDQLRLLASASTQEEMLQLRTKQLAALQLYGTGVMLIYHP